MALVDGKEVTLFRDNLLYLGSTLERILMNRINKTSSGSVKIIFTREEVDLVLSVIAQGSENDPISLFCGLILLSLQEGGEGKIDVTELTAHFDLKRTISFTWGGDRWETF